MHIGTRTRNRPWHQAFAGRMPPSAPERLRPELTNLRPSEKPLALRARPARLPRPAGPGGCPARLSPACPSEVCCGVSKERFEVSKECCGVSAGAHGSGCADPAAPPAGSVLGLARRRGLHWPLTGQVRDFRSHHGCPATERAMTVIHGVKQSQNQPGSC